MTIEDYERDAVLLSQLAGEMKNWPPDALAYVREQIEDADRSLQQIRRKLNTMEAA